MKVKLLNIYILFFCFLSILTIDVSTVEELLNALARAKAGQTISIAPGEYDYSTNKRSIRFELFADGTESSPITITALDPANPPLLRGPEITGHTVLHITGDYWVIENIKISTSHKGIDIDYANHNIIRNVEIFSLGSQGVLIRGSSSHNLFQNCYIHNTGSYNPIFGDGFVIGTLQEQTTFTHDSNYNVIKGCIFRDISSEPIKINEYAIGNEIASNIFFGDGTNGRNDADSFISIAGDDNYVHDNIAYRNLNENIVHAFKVKKHVEDSGDGNKFVNNVLFMDRPFSEKKPDKRMYIVDGVDSQFYVKGNKVDYGEGLVADSEEYYNSNSVTFLE